MSLLIGSNLLLILLSLLLSGFELFLLHGLHACQLLLLPIGGEAVEEDLAPSVSIFFEILLTRIWIASLNSLVFSFLFFLASSRVLNDFWVLSYIPIWLKNVKKALVSINNMVSEQLRPSSPMNTCYVILSISSLSVSSICWTRKNSISFYLFSLFLGLLMGIVKPAASATLTLLCTFGLIANLAW